MPPNPTELFNIIVIIIITTIINFTCVIIITIHSKYELSALETEKKREYVLGNIHFRNISSLCDGCIVAILELSCFENADISISIMVSFGAV